MPAKSPHDYVPFIQSLPAKGKARLYRDAESPRTRFLAYIVIMAPTLGGVAAGFILSLFVVSYEYGMATFLISIVLGIAASIPLMGTVVGWAERRDISRHLNKLPGSMLSNCPSCNYDQSGTQGVECPECGCRVRFR